MLKADISSHVSKWVSYCKIVGFSVHVVPAKKSLNSKNCHENIF